ncbi:MAG: type I glyceraldehyde-3-phosphate dehydrogenase [SAR202 cluster bacterium]|nr:type I glyceraldehyde-3-phosphate dehydrogenase [SAR202 cluster bacterium]|tara:strand:+ start:418 stop:1425 length:1008 start_codon:yes stop_codon:yes gene_type:complete
MATKIGINGFGRIGRQVLRAIIERYPNSLEVVAINDLGDTSTNAHMFRYDSNYGIYPGKVDVSEKNICIDGMEISVIQEREPSKIKWGDFGVEVVVESTGFFTDADKASGHLEGGANKVIISAPAKGEDATIVMGVNEDVYDSSKHNVISNASCTTNCVANMVKVLDDNFGVQNALMTTIHSYTNDQKILDQVHSDLRRARAAAVNIIPTTTGAAKAVGLVLPHLNGKIHGMAFRVPTPTGSVTDLVANLGGKVTVEDINDAYAKASKEGLSGVLQYTDEPLVSSDFIRNSNSVIIDGLSTIILEDNMVKVVGWYDNEWGYSCRTADLAEYISGR